MNFSLEKINIKFKELKALSVEDCHFSKDLIGESFNNTSLIIKWLQYRSEFANLTRQLDNQRKQKYRELFEYYKVDYNLKLSTKEELSLFIESDQNYVDIFNKYMTCKEIVQFLDSVIETLKSRGWEIKNYLDFLRWTQGQ